MVGTSAPVAGAEDITVGTQSLGGGTCPPGPAGRVTYKASATFGQLP